MNTKPYFCFMKIRLICIGKTDSSALKQLTDDYEKRLRFYINFEQVIIPGIKKTKHMGEKQQKEAEGKLLLKKLQASDVLVLLDERGKSYTSTDFSGYLQKKMNAGTKCLVFAIGGPYGFSEEVYEKARESLSLSNMTFSHQMIRLFFTEQLYRAFTILNNEPYHHG